MAERKYARYIQTELKLPEIPTNRLAEYNKRATRVAWMEDFVIPDAPSVIVSWYWKATDEPGTPAHTHDFDEVVGFIGSDPDNPKDLGGEVEFWLDDEQYFLTESCLIFWPRASSTAPCGWCASSGPSCSSPSAPPRNTSKICSRQLLQGE